MVYKITYDLNVSLGNFFNSLNNFGKFILFDNTIYLDSDKHKKELIDDLNAGLTEDEQVLVKAIDFNGYEYPKQIEYWFNKIKYEHEKVDYKQIRQNQIKKALEFLDAFEVELNKQIEGSGGVGKQ